MLAKDVLPSRLERAKLAVEDFTRNLSGDRVGLVLFAGSAFLECPLTLDYDGFLLSLEGASTDSIPKGGTSISSAINEAIRSFEGEEGKHKVLIIISDGEDLEGGAVKRAREAKEKGIVIFCVGVGSQEGDLIPAAVNEGAGVFLKDRSGNVVKSRLDEETLKNIALTTGGSYLRANQAEFGLDVLYREKISKMEKKEFESKMSKHYQERFQLPLLIGFLLLLAETMIVDKK
jgi:Ca-activated chloride channel family protein